MSKLLSAQVWEKVEKAKEEGRTWVDTKICGSFGNQSIYIEKIVGYCHYADSYHEGVLTPKLMNGHKCLEKNCLFYEKYNDEYWDALEKAEREKREQKEFQKQQAERKKQEDEQLEADILSAVLYYIQGHDIPIQVTGFTLSKKTYNKTDRNPEGRCYIVHYVANYPEYSIHTKKDIAFFLNYVFGYRFEVNQITLPEGEYAYVGNIPKITENKIAAAKEKAKNGYTDDALEWRMERYDRRQEEYYKKRAEERLQKAALEAEEAKRQEEAGRKSSFWQRVKAWFQKLFRAP